MPALALTQARAACASALAPRADTDPAVLVDLVDSITPPALMLEWNDPWITPGSVAGSAGLYTATLNVIAFAGRVEPGPGVATLEALLVYVVERLQADAHGWRLTISQAPRRFDMAGVPWLGVRISFEVPVAIQ